MALYKGFEVDNDLYAVIRHMDHVKKYRDELQQQQITWDYLSVMAQLANLDNELSNARQQFTNLTGVLLNRLGLETLKKSVNEYGFKAQVAINIMVRNLFERTADIGFLATDDDIRHFLQHIADGLEGAELDAQRQSLRARFQEYVNKYSVYHDIILLDTDGKVLLQLDQTNPVIRSKDALIKESLNTQEVYVESYGYSDLLPHQQNSLIYSFRVASADAKQALGIVCLCFRFENETTGIFNHLLDEDDNAILMLLNAEGHVMATSHAEKIPLNAKFKYHLDEKFSVINYNGSEYFCCVKKADAYQGYAGAGWLGYVMVPLDKLFKPQMIIDTSAFTPTLMASAMLGDLFDEEVKTIPQHANQIQNELNRSVWNGNVFQASEKNGPDAAVSKVLLGEIKNTGLDTKHIFERSISEIQKTVMVTALKDSESRAALAIDIMDRNLYERANDCRWWALNTTFRALLDNKNLQPNDVNKMQSMLRYINGLYTVYSNLLVFDKQGKVIAVSNPHYQSLVGSILQEPWVKSMAAIYSSEHYAVSDLVPTPLYDGEASYIYSAAIRSMGSHQMLGGIGIIFDAKPQFLAMLQDVLPKTQTGEARANCFAVFTDHKKNVIASSSEHFSTGDVFAMDDTFYALKNGQSMSKVVSFGQAYYAIGCSKSAGYREFKGASDHYQQEVYAFVFNYIGEVQTLTPEVSYEHPEHHQVMTGNQCKTQLATFYVGADWLGFKSEQVASAVPVGKLVPIRGGESSIIAGYMMYKGESLALIHTAMLMGAKAPPSRPINEAVVIKINGSLVGLVIDSLGEMLDVDPQNILPVGKDIAVSSKVVREVVLSNPQTPKQKMLQMLDIALIAKQFKPFILADADVVLG